MLTLKLAAERLNLGPVTLRIRARARKLRARLAGQAYLVTVSEVARHGRWRKQLRVSQTPRPAYGTQVGEEGRRPMGDGCGNRHRGKGARPWRYGGVLIGLLLVGCGGSAKATVAATATQAGSIGVATATRAVELTQVATVLVSPAAPTTTSATTTLPPTPRTGLTTDTPTVRTPTTAAQATRANTASPAASGTGRVVTVTAKSGANIRSKTTTDAAVVVEVVSGNNLAVIEDDVTASDGLHWVHVRYMGKEGYIRNDLVGLPHAG